MSITSRLLDRLGRHLSAVEWRGLLGLAVATFPAEELEYFDAQLLHGVVYELGVNGSSGGTSVVVWNGTGALDTGGDWTLTTTGMSENETSAAAHSGTNGLDTGTVSDGYIYLDSGSMFDVTAYDTVSVWIHTVAWNDQDAYVRFEWRDANDNQVGDRVYLQDYTNVQVGAWQLLTIPVADFALTGSARTLRIRCKRSQRQYFDDITLSAGGGASLGPQVYSIQPATGERYELNSLLLLLVGSATGWAHGDFAHIDGGLPSGVLIRVRDTLTGALTYIANLRDNMDLYGRFTAVNSVSFLDAGHLETFELRLDPPIRLSDQQTLELVVRDDLSGLLRAQCRVRGGYRRSYATYERSENPPAKVRLDD